MRLLCELGRHRAGPRPRWNDGYYFSKCKGCGSDLVRTPFERWQVPHGYRVVWSPRPPEHRPTARLAPAPPWTPTEGAAAETDTLVEPTATQAAEAADTAASPIKRSVFAWVDPPLPRTGADKPDGLPIGEVLRILREEEARANHEPEGGTILPATEPIDLTLAQDEPAPAATAPFPRPSALSSRRQRSRLGLRVAIATAIGFALALAGAAIASH